MYPLRNIRGAPSRADLATLVLCASLPILAWFAWSVYAFGDVTGSAEKIEGLGWTPKPIGEWWSHPVFTPRGLASGALIPALVLYVYGLDRALGWTGMKWPVILLLRSICVLMLGSEIAISRPTFSSPYNGLHLWAAVRPA